MDNLNFQNSSFDTIICIDALYFVNDLDATITGCKEILGADGQMGFFYTQVNSPDDPKNFLNAGETKLAQVLNRLKFAYQTWDYTEDERAHWRRSKEIAEDLKAEFEKEGNIELYESRIKESDKLLEVVNDNRISRYLYHVQS
jgi:ubiquinone/menaquinone biosynthesis C-methylase UbiE